MNKQSLVTVRQFFLIFMPVFFLSACTQLAEPLKIPEKPAPQHQQVMIDIERQSNSSGTNDILQLPLHKIKVGNKLIVSAPLIKKKYRIKDVVRTGVSFQNDLFYKVAEQQIEKNLLRKGLNIISREKLEAEFKNYQNTHNAINPGKGLLDVSSIIRAAQLKGVDADYLLKISSFKNMNKTYQIDLAGYEPFQLLLTNFPEATGELLARQYIECLENIVSIEAKVIHIASGSVVWIANSSLSSRDLDNKKMQVKMAVNKTVNNEVTIMDYVKQQNTKQARKLRYGKDVEYPSWQHAVYVSTPVVTQGNCQMEASNSEPSEQQKKLITTAINRFLNQMEIN